MIKISVDTFARTHLLQQLPTDVRTIAVKLETRAVVGGRLVLRGNIKDVSKLPALEIK